MQIRLLPFAVALAASALLAGCNSQPQNITAEDIDPTAKEIAAAPPVKLPPAITASKTYRCKDNGLVYVDFFNDGTSAQIRTVKDGTPIALTAPAAAQPFAGGGYTVTGSGKTVSITQPGKGEQSCNG